MVTLRDYPIHHLPARRSGLGRSLLSCSMIRFRKYTLVVLIFSLLLGAVSAEIAIDGGSVYVETDGYSVEFDRGVITYVHNKRTGETYTIPESDILHEDTAVYSMEGRNIWARWSAVEAIKTGQDSVSLVFSQPGIKLILTIEVEPMTNDLLIEGSGEADTTGIFNMQLGFDNIDINNVDLILPVLGGQIITASSPFESKRHNYPGHWETQLAIVQGEQGGFFVRGTDRTFQFKELKWEKNSEEMVLAFKTYNQAPWDTHTTVQSTVWRFNTYAGDYRVPARIYRHWMEEAFEPRHLSDMPSWVEDIGLVVILGLFDEEFDWLFRLAEQVDPTKTLLYVVQWRESGHDQNLPDYTPKAILGDFMETVRDLGYRVMLHTNIIGVSTYHPFYLEVQQHQFRDAWTGELKGWKWDEPDNEYRHAWINLASSQFRAFLVSRLYEVWQAYPIDAFHLDANYYLINDANGLIEGLNAAQGNVLMHKQLADAMPGVVFSGEHLHEVTFFRESFAQRWKLGPGLTPHPISTFLFAPYTRPYGYLGLPPSWRNPLGYQTFLDSYEIWGVLPTLTSGDLKQPFYYPLTQQMLDTARQWQEFGPTPVIPPEPDINQDGVVNVLDLVVVANRFGTMGGDINGDGTTNILDLVIVSQHFR